MPRIRFTADPKLPRDIAHLGYRKDQEHDVTDDEAERWLRRGVAIVVPVPEPRRGRSKPEPVRPPVSLLGSSVLPALIRIGDADVQLGEIVAAVHVRSGLSVEAWNDMPDAERETLLSVEVQARRAAAAA